MQQENLMHRHLISSEDGSPTLFSEDFGEAYHSTAGAMQESRYLFIGQGLLKRASGMPEGSPLRVLEYGFGTGLNALLTLQALQEEPLLRNRRIRYTSLEKYPLTEEEYTALHYGNDELLLQLHRAPWYGADDDPAQCFPVGPEGRFLLRKIRCGFSEYRPREERFDVVYFDAFSPDTQPESWSAEIFGRCAAAMDPEALLVTYSAKGTVKQALREAGLEVRRIPGTGHKRHNVVAVRR